MNKIKRAIGVIAILAVLSMPISAQVFFLDIDGEDNLREDELELVDLDVLEHSLTQDQTNYAPVGSGVLLLAALGGAYLLGKKKEK